MPVAVYPLNLSMFPGITGTFANCSYKVQNFFNDCSNSYHSTLPCTFISLRFFFFISSFQSSAQVSIFIEVTSLEAVYQILCSSVLRPQIALCNYFHKCSNTLQIFHF